MNVVKKVENFNKASQGLSKQGLPKQGKKKGGFENATAGVYDIIGALNERGVSVSEIIKSASIEKDK